jgi:redox-sensing transcriptional repressor
MRKLPGKTVERLSEYRRALLRTLSENKSYIFSHELAAILHITAVQVRRDLMLIGYASVMRKGYDIRELIETIGQIIDAEAGLNVAIIGMGNLGRALTGYFSGKRTKLRVVASFDVDQQKVDKVISGVKCYHINDLRQYIQEFNIAIAVITVPPDHAKSVASALVKSGIKGILNFTTVALNVPENVFLEEFDLITSVEKVAYFVKEGV